MQLTLVTVAHPKSRLEIRHCVETYRKHATEPFRWLFLTEAANVPALEKVVPGERVEAMAPEAEAIGNPYMRQMGAKLLCWRAVESEQLVITDDDTEAIGPWGRETFFDDQNRARYYYRNTPMSFWGPGQELIFPDRPERDFQLLLPFAMRRESLRDLAESPAGSLCLDAWHRKSLLSEFMVMGEWAWRESARETRSVFHNTLVDHTHWTLGRRPVFRDWQGFRRAFRKKIARGF